jgi:hypothetical protein
VYYLHIFGLWVYVCNQINFIGDERQNTTALLHVVRIEFSLQDHEVRSLVKGQNNKYMLPIPNILGKIYKISPKT